MNRHSHIRGLLLAFCAATIFPLVANGWEVKVQDVDRRMKEAKRRWSEANGNRAVQAILRDAKQVKKPGWVQRIPAGSASIYWSETYGGKTYHFSASYAKSVKNLNNPGLFFAAAQNAALSELAKVLGTSNTSTEDMAPFPSSRIQDVVWGTVAIDWYASKDGTLYALLVAPR
ncbi:MAG: hypothetical protein NTY77_12985 [Elusimicrobia bacterium]|nr:hypothetical protein [Elusimicrobiota bacterium]